MRMKEICGATGLTDRAVRHYIKNGLITPRREPGGPGRENIIFGEADLAALGHVAALRRAGFSIDDIRLMQNQPGMIARTVAAHRKKLGESAKRNQEMYNLLSGVSEENAPDVAALAGIIASEAGGRALPREDTRPGKREVLDSLSRYAAAPVSLTGALAGTAYVAVLMAHVLMYSGGGLETFPGGKYELTNVFTLDRLLTYWIFLPIAVCLAAIIYCHYAYIKRGRLRSLAVSALSVAAVCVLFLFIPLRDVPGGFATWEAIFARKLIIPGLLSPEVYHRYASFFLKFVPFALSLIFLGVAVLLRALSIRAAGGAEHQTNNSAKKASE